MWNLFCYVIMVFLLLWCWGWETEGWRHGIFLRSFNIPGEYTFYGLYGYLGPQRVCCFAFLVSSGNLYAIMILAMNYRIYMSPSQGGGGGSCSLDPLIFLDFIPCSPLIKPLVPKNVFSSCSLDPEIFLRCSLDPQKYLSLFPIFVCLFYLSTHWEEKNRFWTTSFFSLESAHAYTSSTAVSIILTNSAASLTVTTSLVWWGTQTICLSL